MESANPSEGSHNGIAAVLKTADRKVMRVRIPRPPQRMKPKTELPLFFQTQKEWAAWLAKNYTKEEGIWLRFYKKASGIASINHDQALDSALCYGWIDGQA